MHRALRTKHTDKFTSPRHNLLALQVKAKIARDKGLSGSRCHTLRHIQRFCSSLAAVLLIFLEDIAQDNLSCCSSYIPEIRTIVLFLPL